MSIIAELRSLFEIAQNLYNIREAMKGNQKDLKRLLDRCQDFRSFVDSLKQQEASPDLIPSATQNSARKLLALLQDIWKFQDKIQRSTLRGALKRLAFCQTISTEIASLNQRLTELAIELNVGQQLDQARRQREDVEDTRAMFEATVEEIMAEIQEQEGHIEGQIEELRREMTSTLRACLEAVSGLNASSSSASATASMAEAELEQMISQAVQALERKLDGHFAAIRSQIFDLGVQGLAADLSDIKLEMVQSNQEILEASRRFTESIQTKQIDSFTTSTSKANVTGTPQQSAPVTSTSRVDITLNEATNNVSVTTASETSSLAPIVNSVPIRNITRQQVSKTHH
jgi:hypothetical protein